MLQMMQKKITEEAEKEKELFDKFMCYCKTSGGELKEAVAAATSKIPSVGADIKASESQKVHLQESLKQHQTDRSAAKTAIEEATAIREKEAAAFAKEKAELDANLAALSKGINAIEKGMAGGFLQTGAAKILRNLLSSQQDMLDADRQEVMAFLSGSESSDSEYAPKSGEIVGILKEIHDEMSKSLADATNAENKAIQDYEELMAAKKKEVEALTTSIETKTERVGSLAVEIVQMKNDLTDTEAQLLEDQKFQAELEKSCGTKEEEWAEREKTRSEELVAIADTIKLLNDDDALDLFKKTLPSASASFVQVGSAARRQRDQALAFLRAAASRAGAEGRHPEFGFLAMALQGRKVGLDKVMKMIDNLVATLQKEQVDDDNKREYCAKALDEADDKKKGLGRQIEDLETAIADAEEGISTLKDEIKALTAGLKTLDKEVAEQTEMRKDEHKEFTELMSSNSAAKEVLGMAKNRLNQFYNPKLYRPKETAPAAPALVQISAHAAHHDRREAPPPAPETYGAYSKKSEESNGVIAMIDLLIKDLDKEMTEAETEEENAQSQYTKMMQESGERRAADSKSLMQKQDTKAALETDLESSKEKKAGTGKELMATMQYIKSLHSECDWLMQYYDVRKEARAGEIDALKKAKAVLSGADFSLLQKRLQLQA